jgi:hypothetical protein
MPRYVVLILSLIILASTALSQENKSAEQPQNIAASTPEDFKVLASGFSQPYSTGVRFAFVVENTNDTTSFQYSKYQVAAYDASGSVLGTSSGQISMIFPGEKLGEAGTIETPENTRISRLDVQIRPGEARTLLVKANPLSTEKARYLPDRYNAKVTGIVKSNWDKDLDTVQVAAILYDSSGAIIDGGIGFVEFVPAKGQAAVEVHMPTGGEPARVELYPFVMAPTQFR